MTLTLALADARAQVLAVEKDESLVPVLREVLATRGVDRVTVHEADALTLDWPTLLAGAPSWTFVANLPYNVAVPIVLSVLEHAPMVQRLVVMVQREVAERLAAGPGGRTIGIPSLRVSLTLRPSRLASIRVPRSSTTAPARRIECSTSERRTWTPSPIEV